MVEAVPTGKFIENNEEQTDGAATDDSTQAEAIGP